MVAFITGKGVGLERSSALVLGSRGQLGSAAIGRDGEGVYVNVANGNLVITRQDEFLIGLGPNISVDRTYNSQASLSDGDNNDNWRMSPYRKVTGLSGSYGGAGTTVKRIDWDGSDRLYTWNATYIDATHGAYVATDGRGAYDMLVRSGTTWTWTDGDSQVTESYDDNAGGRITAAADPDGNSVGYAYNGAGQISRVTNYNAAGTGDDDYTDFSYSGTLLTQLVTTKGAGGSLTRVRYAYLGDGTNRLATVTVDLSPNDSLIADGATYFTTYTYDGTSTRLASITQQDGSSISFTYVQVGADYKVASFTQSVAAGVTRSTFFDYSAANRTTITDPAGQKTILWYNANGELTQISYPPEDANTTPRVVQFGYDVSGDGDVTSVTLGPGNVVTYDYDQHGNRKFERDSAGNTIVRTYGARNELLTETRYLVPDPDGAGAGQPATALTTRYAYDGENHLRYVVSAEGFVTQYEYDSAGRRTAANEYAGNAYSIAGLADNASIAEATLTGWVTGLDKTTARRTETLYDYRGNIATSTSWSKLLSNGLFDTGSELSQTNYVYDQAGKLLSRTVTGSAGSELFVYDGLGRETMATDFNGAVTRTTFLDSTGQTVLTHANGLSEVSTYDRAGELVAFSRSEAGGNLVDLTGWPGNPASVPAGQATVPGWMNPSGYTDETQWAATTGPDGLQVVAMRAGQLDSFQEGGGNYTNEAPIDATKAYEFTYYFKLSDLNKHAIYFGLSGTAPAMVENLDGTDNSNPYFFTRWITDQTGTFTADKWYKVVAYVLPQGAANPGAPLGGVYDNATGQKILDVTNFRWNAERPGNTVHSRFFDYYGEASLQYSTYFYQPEIRQVSTASLTGPETSTSLYRYDSLGRLRMTIDPTGRRNYMMYDSIGRKVADVDSDGSVLEYRYDGNDNLTSTTRYATKLTGAQLALLAVLDAPVTINAVGSSLLSNGGFETSGSYTTTPYGRTNPTLPGWSKTNAEDFEQVASGQGGVTASEGSYWLDLDSYVVGALVPTGSNLLTNGSFDTSGSYTTTSTGRSNTTLPGWTKTNSETFEQVTAGQLGVTGTDGSFWLDLDSVATGSTETPGSNQVSLGGWPADPNNLPSGNATVSGWQNPTNNVTETIWASVPPPGGGANVVAMRAGQVDADVYGGGNYTNAITIDPTKKYQFTYYFRLTSVGKHDIGLGLSPGTPPYVVNAVSGDGGNDPYFFSMTAAMETAYGMVQNKWYKVVGYVLPEGSANVAYGSQGGIYDATTGARLGDALIFRWNAGRPNNTVYSRMGVGNGTSNIMYSTDFLKPEIREIASVPTGGGNMDISQTVGGLSAGQVMQLQFNHANRTSSGSGSFEVYWNNTLIATITDTGTAMQTKTYQVTAVAGNNTIRFKGTGTVDSSGASIDNVRLYAMAPTITGGNMDISQTVGGLAAGQVMQLQFDHANRTTAASGSFEVYWNNSLIATITDTGAAMQTKTYQVTAVAGNNTIRFKGIGTVDTGGASLDNVRLFATQAVPGPLTKLADIRPTATANDAWTFQVYDLAQRLVQTIDGTGATSVLSYDGASRLVSTTSYANRLDAATLANLKALANNPNRWNLDANGLPLGRYNLSAVAAGTIDGANAHQVTVGALTDWQAIYTDGFTVTPGQTASATITVKAVGSLTSDYFGLYGATSGWSPDADAYATIVSGPGQLTQNASLFYITGLSTTEATRVTITRTYRIAEWGSPYFYLGNSAVVQGWSTIISAPVSSSTPTSPILPTADATNDRVARSFYDNDGRLIGALDGEGSFTETVYDKGGKKIRSIAYAAATTASLRAAGTFAQLRADAIQNGSANMWASPTDPNGWANWGLQAPEAAGTIDGYNAFKFTIAQAGTLGGIYNWTSGIPAGETTSLALSVKAVGAQTSITFGPAGYNGQWSWGPDDYSTVQIVSGPGTATRIAGALWTVSGLSATEATRIIITKRATGAQDEVPHIYVAYYTREAGAALILSNPVFSRGNPADIETNYVYDSRGLLRATVDGEGGLTRYRYTPLGDVDEEIRGQKLAAVDLPLAGLKFAGLPAAAGGTILETTTFARNLYGQVLTETKSLTGGTSTVTAYAYDNMGRLVSTTSQSGGADPRTASQRFDLRGRLIGELGGIGNASLPGNPTPAQIDQAYATYGVSYAYDAADRMISSTDARGARSLYYYDSDGRLVFQVDPLGEVAENRYDALGRQTDTIVYAARIASATLAGMTGGNATAVAATMAALASGGFDTSHVDFDVDDSVKQSSDPLGNLTTFSYNAFGDLVSDIAPRDGAATIQTSRSYDRRGLLKTEIVDSAAGGKAIATTYGYDAFGRAVTLTNALNKVTSSAYDRKGRLVRTTDALNAVTSYAYDARDNLVAVTDALGKVTRYVYDKADRKIAVIDALGGVTATTYDADGRVVATRAYLNTISLTGLPLEVTESALALPATNAADHVTRFAYDKDGQLRFAVDALMHVVENVYDVAGNLIRVVAYDGTIATDGTGVYSAAWIAGQVAGLAGAAGTRTSRSVYDVANRLIYAVDAIGQVTWVSYDAKGNAIRQVELAALYTAGGDPSLATMDAWSAANANPTNDRTTRAYYDRKGRLSYSIDALGFVTRFEYDKLANVKKQSRYAAAYSATDSTTLANLDAAFASPPADTRVTQFNYDSAGRLEETIDPEGFSTKLVLDQLGQITSSTAAFGLGAASVTSYTYDDVGRVLTETYGAGAAEASVTAFVYDALGQITQQTAASGTADTAVSKWEYDAIGRLTKRTLGYGTAEVADTLIAYDSFSRVTGITDPRGSVVNRSYDLLDRLSSETVQLETGTTDDQVTSYTYDNFGDAVKVHDALGNDSFAYFDKLGRVFRQVDAGQFVTDTTYTRGGKVATLKRWANAATGTIVETAVPASPAADALHDATTIFTYNKRDELTAVQDAGGATESYGLNGFGDRISLTNKLGNTTNYTFDKRGLAVSETLPVTTKNAGGATISVTNTYAYDARGNRTQMIEAAGAVEARTTNYAYDKLDRLTTTTRDAVTIVNDDLTSSNVTPTETIKYDRRGNVIETIDAGGARTLFWYDDLDRAIAQVSQSDRVTLKGTLTRTTYDGNGNATSTKVYGDLIALPADATGAIPTAFDANNYRLTSYAYDRANRLTTTTVAALRTGVFSGSSYLTTFSGDVTTTNYYDKAGNVFAEADGNGNASWSWYDKLGRKIAQVDREYYLTVWTRDAEGNVLSETRYATQLGSFSYGSVPPSVAASAADRTTLFEYDRNGRRTKEQRLAVAYTAIDPGTGAATDYAATDPSAKSIVTYTYNGLGEVLTRSETLGADSYSYDAIGRMTFETRQSFTDYQGASVTPRTAYAYDGLDNLKSSRVQLGAVADDVNDRITSYTYGAGGRMATMTDAAGFTHSYGYDAAGRLVRDSYLRTKSDGTSLTEAQVTRYDLAGRAVVQTSARQSGGSWLFTDAAGAAYDAIRIRYNAYGEVSGRGLTAGPNAAEAYQATFDYDEGSRLWRSTGDDGSIRILFYDKAGNATLTLSSVGADLAGQTYAGAMASLTAAGGTTIANAVTTIGVFDRRGQQLQTREPDRQLSAGTTRLVVHGRTYNAFGEIASETDARGFDTSGNAIAFSGGAGYTTTYSYNTMGRLLSKVSPQVSVTAENGAVSNVNPTEYYGYDLSGRLVSVRDANGNRTTRTLLAGTGQDGSEAAVLKEFHPDAGVFERKYDVFGGLRATVNEIGKTEAFVYDKMDRLIEQDHQQRPAGSPGNPTGAAVQLIDYYAYDGLGRRLQHWNSQYGASVKETTDYDAQGRVEKMVALGGDTTTTGYVWSGTQETLGLGTFGGWIKTTLGADGHSQSETLDYFGRTIDRVDGGGHDYNLTFDKGGRLVSQAIVGAATTSMTWFNTGLLASQSANGLAAAYGYDENGRRTNESYGAYQNATVTWDAMGRMATYADTGAVGGAAPASISYQYDAVGNVRRMAALYSNIDSQGEIFGSGYPQEYWYRYDSMNRFVTTQGTFTGTAGSGSIVGGTQLSYDAAGNRATATLTASRTKRLHKYVPSLGAHIPRYYDDDSAMITPDDGGGTWSDVDYAFFSGQVETYSYTADGYLAGASIAVQELAPTGDLGKTNPQPAAIGASVPRATYEYDAMGRVVSYSELNPAGASVYSRTATYNAKSQLTYDSVSSSVANTSGGTDAMVSSSNYYYTTAGGQYLGGALDRYVASNTKNGALQATVTTSNAYTWWDGPRQSSNTVATDYVTGTDTNYTSTYYFDGLGHVSSVYIGDGRARTVTFVTDIDGRVLQRDEADSLGTGDPREFHYYFNGMQLGGVSNNGTSDVDYVTGIARHTAAPGTGPFQGGSANATNYVDFDQSYDPINGLNMAASASHYTTNQGDTLQSIALAVWGDASLWYLIADANGLTGSENLVAGVTLVIPNKVANFHNSADTFRVYDPNKALGDLSPTAPKPPKAAPKRGCGMIGQILVAIVAVAVAIALPELSPFFAKGIGLVLAGVISNVASQGVAIATGVQNKFSWKGVAMAAVTAGVGLGLNQVMPGAIAGSRFVADVVRGAASSAISQGIGVATGLQSKFDWAGVAAAGVSAGVAGAVNRAMSRTAANPAAAGAQQGGPAVPATIRVPTLAGHVLSGAAGSIAAAATRSLATGTSFGDNILATLPDVIANTLGLIAQDALSRHSAEIHRERQRARIAARPEFADADDPRIDAANRQLIQIDSLTGSRPGQAFSRLGDSDDGFQVLRRSADAMVDPEIEPMENYDRAEQVLRRTTRMTEADYQEMRANLRPRRMLPPRPSRPVYLPPSPFSDAPPPSIIHGLNGAEMPPISSAPVDNDIVVNGDPDNAYAVGRFADTALIEAGRAATWIADNIDRHWWVKLGITVVSAVLSPVSFLVGELISHSPVGAAIDRVVEAASGYVANQFVEKDYSDEDARNAGVGAIALVGLLSSLALGVRALVPLIRNGVRRLGGAMANLRTAFNERRAAAEASRIEADEAALRAIEEEAATAAEAGGTPRTRLPRTNGRWVGEPGNGVWFSDNPDVLLVTGGRGVRFVDGRPDFSPWSQGRLSFREGVLTGEDSDFGAVYRRIARERGLPSAAAGRRYLDGLGLTPHHVDARTILLIPSKLHNNVPHIGSASDLRNGR